MALRELLGSHSSHPTEKLVRCDFTPCPPFLTKVRSHRVDHVFRRTVPIDPHDPSQVATIHLFWQGCWLHKHVHGLSPSLVKKV
jgi:hypothetical protein